MQRFSQLFRILLVFFAIISFAFPYEKAQAAANLQTHFIDVGQGDATLIELPNGQNLLIDAADNEYAQTVVDYIRNEGISRIDYVVGTHPHADHIGGLDHVINTFSIGKVYMPNKTATTQTYIDVINAIKNKGLTITQAKAGVTLVNTTVDGKALRVYMVAPVASSYSDVNDYSAVVKIEYGTTSFLITGDSELPAETDMINSGQDLSADILKVSHHGSTSSSSDAFLNKVNATVAVISVGPNNYGHPTSTVINRLKNRGMDIYRTDYNGDIIFTTSGSGWLVNKTAWWK